MLSRGSAVGGEVCVALVMLQTIAQLQCFVSSIMLFRKTVPLDSTEKKGT